ncbi:GNAT family N-acetyltransferase [Streptomyces sp. CAI-85]|uniref:GNAT family N-acetyltransferase n=1 Tax=Streptomyces sp. CAI-85 TaxID=1472662 RepID=UPI001587A589|nr:GNAT family N-acetyltransferase [Streptomyces sp. CAI-85]NUV58446.1 GNAT family N-acetyltransferase [Streptomyces sp. CAI-85]
MSDDGSLLARIERYYATVPLLFADAEEYGTLRLFVRKEPGAPYYGGPGHAQPSGAGGVADGDIARVRARQRELGVPETFEWLAEAAPDLRERVGAAGLTVAERPLMVLDPGLPRAPQALPAAVSVRAVKADDPALPAVLALPRPAFGRDDTAGVRELAAAAEGVVADGTVEAVRPTLRGGHKRLLAAFGPDGVPLAAGHYHPAGGATEIGGVGTLPTARRQGLAAAVTTALAVDAREHGVTTVFLAYAAESVARLYARLGFRPAGVTLLIADQPARS